MNVTGIQRGVYSWVSSETSWPVVWAQQNAPAPRSPYVTLQLGGTSRIGEEFLLAPNGDGTSVNVGTRELMVSVQAYGSGARQEAETIRDSLSKVTVRDTLAAARLYWVDSEPVQNISSLLPTQFEERAGLDVRMRTWSDTTDVPGWIETIDGTAVMLHPDDSTAYDGTFTVTL